MTGGAPSGRVAAAARSASARASVYSFPSVIRPSSRDARGSARVGAFASGRCSGRGRFVELEERLIKLRLVPIGEVLERAASRAGRIAAIAFSSKSQVQRLAELAGADELRATLGHCEVAAMGPVVAQALAELGIVVGAMPDRQWFMKPLASELQTLFSNTSAAGS